MSEQDTDHKSQILIVDDHPIVCSGLKRVMQKTEDLVMAGSAASIPEAMKLLTELSPDLALVDIHLGKENGLDLVRHIVTTELCPVLVITGFDESLYAIRALRAGARGYVTKEESFAVIIDAIRAVLGGNIYLKDEIKSDIFKILAGGAPDEAVADPAASLSGREQEVLAMIGQGANTKQIADTLDLSISTVETHKANIKRKLGVENSRDLVRQALITGGPGAV